jgi:dipeptidyl aminopeptidase/acylaminoacyl peptidase
MKSRIRLADLYSLLTPGQPRVSPDGRRVAYVVQGFRKKENDRYQNLWMATTDGSTSPHRLTRGTTRDSAPAWSPDGRYLAFLSTREHELEVAAAIAEAEGGAERKKGTPDKPQTQLWLLDTQWGGEPRQLTWRDEGVTEFDWSPDGSQLVFSSRDPEEAQKAYLDSIRGKGKEGEKGPLVIDRVQHKLDGSGYLDDVKTHLFTVEVKTRKVQRLTSGPCNETAPRWSPDGRWIAFTSNRTGDADNNHRNDLWLISPDGTAARRLTAGDVGAGTASWSPDGRHLAFVSSLAPENAYLLRHLLVVGVDDAEVVEDLAAHVGRGWSQLGGVVPDRPAGDVVSSARAYPVPLKSTAYQVLTAGLDRPAWGTPLWLNQRELLFVIGDRGQTRLARAGLGGLAQPVFPGLDRLCSLSHSDYHAAGGVLVLGMSSPAVATELYSVPLSALDEGAPEKEAIRLTHHNVWLEDRLTARYERITYPSSGGVEVEALCALPPGFDPSQSPVPLLVKIHGGPMSYDSPEFRFDVQHWAGQGYLVLMVNYRGSISYGEEFCQVIRGDWGPREHDDVMHGVQAVLDRGWVDERRMYCTGFSQGGIMTNWAVGHTDRFQAAVSEHGMWDYIAAYGTDDCHRWWQDDLGVPWQNPEQYRRISPAVGVENIRTPLLITAGELDWRCPLNQSEQLYLALKKRGVPTRLVIYQGERHAITAPRRALDRICRILRWFAAYGGLPLDDDSAGSYPDPS